MRWHCLFTCLMFKFITWRREERGVVERAGMVLSAGGGLGSSWKKWDKGDDFWLSLEEWTRVHLGAGTGKGPSRRKPRRVLALRHAHACQVLPIHSCTQQEMKETGIILNYCLIWFSKKETYMYMLERKKIRLLLFPKISKMTDIRPWNIFILFKLT